MTRLDKGEFQSRPRAGGTYFGFGPGVFQPFFNRPQAPKTTPYRAIADALGHEALRIDPQSIADETVEALTEALSRGKAGSLPYARATYWANKLGAKKAAGFFKKRQANFIKDAIDLVKEVATQSAAIDNAKRGSIAWEKARRDLDRARVKLSNHLSKSVEYTHPLEYSAKAYKASLLSAPHIPFFNVIAQAWQFPLHEVQKAIDFMVPAKVFQKWGIPYEKAPVDIRTWGPAMARELGAIKSGAKSSFGDVMDMLRYGVTETGLNIDAAERIAGKEEATGTTDKYEFGHRPRMIPGVDQTIMMVGRAQGAADVLFFNVVFATALAAEADATARKIARDYPQLKLTKDKINALARDLAHDPSPAMIVAAGDEASRFKLDYPTLDYRALQALRNLPIEKYAGRQLDRTWKASFDWVIPFSKIPLAAADMAFFRYSPAGFVRVGSRLAAAKSAQAKKQEFTGRFASRDVLARDTAELYRQSIVGTLTWATLGILGSLGYMAVTGGGDDDNRENIAATREALGERYTPELVVGDTALDLQRLGPAGQAAAVGARMATAGKRRYDKQTQDYEPQTKRLDRVLSTGAGAVALGTPLGHGAKDIVEALDSESVSGGLGKFAAGKARAAVPGLLRDVAKVSTPTKVIPEDNSGLGRFEGDLRSGVPSLRKKMQPRLDALGRPVEEPDPFSVMRSLRRGATVEQLEDLRNLDVGLSKPQREKGESAGDYNKRVRERGELLVGTLGELREDETMRSATTAARRAVYQRSLQAKQMERAGKLTHGSVRIERQIEALRGDAFAALRLMPEYRKLGEKDKEAVRKLIDEEMGLFRARASSTDSRGRFRAEKSARVPDWTSADLAKAPLEARQ